MDWDGLLIAGLIGYGVGSIPSGVLAARAFGWPDPRKHGSGHTGALNTSRGAGKSALILVLLLDALKGLAAVWVGTLSSQHPYAIAVAGIAAVVGHCWPIWLRFSGGMGLATAIGAVLLYAPLVAIVASLTLLVVRKLVIKHTPRAVIASLLIVPIAVWLARASMPVMVLTLGVTIILIVRHTADWNRVYPTERIE